MHRTQRPPTIDAKEVEICPRWWTTKHILRIYRYDTDTIPINRKIKSIRLRYLIFREGSKVSQVCNYRKNKGTPGGRRRPKHVRHQYDIVSKLRYIFRYIAISNTAGYSGRMKLYELFPLLPTAPTFLRRTSSQIKGQIIDSQNMIYLVDSLQVTIKTNLLADSFRADRLLIDMICIMQLMLPGGRHIIRTIKDIFPGLDLYYTDPAQHITTLAG